MKCPNCNIKVSELDKKCPNCGINFDDYEAYNSIEEEKIDLLQEISEKLDKNK